MKNSDQAFVDKLEFVWKQYYREEKTSTKTKLVRNLFNVIDFVELPKVIFNSIEKERKRVLFFGRTDGNIS